MRVNIEAQQPSVKADLARCQCEWKAGSFMTLGPRPWVRCDKAPTVVVRELALPFGEMSLCDEHLDAFKQHDGRQVETLPIVRYADGRAEVSTCPRSDDRTSG